MISKSDWYATRKYQQKSPRAPHFPPFYIHSYAATDILKPNSSYIHLPNMQTIPPAGLKIILIFNNISPTTNIGYALGKSNPTPVKSKLYSFDIPIHAPKPCKIPNTSTSRFGANTSNHPSSTWPSNFT